MKRILCATLAFLMLLGAAGTALAADIVVQVIGEMEEETESVNLDDLKLKTEAEIDGWGIITLTEFDFIDSFHQYRENSTNYSAFNSGAEADYAYLRVDILNTALKSKDFLANVSVKAVYDDVYIFNGWYYQSDFDKSYPKYALHPNNQFAIDPLYLGHFIFGCTLPNAVVSSDKPLALIITIDGNEITYNIRK